MSPKSIQRFISKIQKSDGCWEWLGYKKKLGYGQFYTDNRRYEAHRLSYEFFNQTTIPKGMVIDHLCRNPKCVNPKHLEPVTPGENTLRGESPAAKFARRSHCMQGHPLSGSNVWLRINKSGKPWRKCKACACKYQTDYRNRLKLKV